tara:strand:+ start:12577 stop:21672 length:9096 start_codon:yes stop_codon:yes gene_type:complete
MDETQLVTSVDQDIEEEKEEDSGFDLMNLIKSEDSNIDFGEDTSEEESADGNEIDSGALNDKSESRIIAEVSDAENYNLNALKGKFDTKKHFWFTNIEYAPEHVRGKRSFRGSAGDALRFIDRAGITFAQGLVDTLQDIGRQDMPAYMAELITGDVVGATTLGGKAIQKAIKNKSLYTLFNELGFTKEGGENRMSVLDATASTFGNVNNFEQFDALSGYDRLNGKRYGLFGLPSLVEMSGGFPERDTGRPVADFTTNLFGDSLPFFATTAAIMSSPTPMDDVALVGNTYRSIKASSPAFRVMVNFINKRSPAFLTKSAKFVLKNSVSGARAGAVAETALGNPYENIMDDFLPDYFKSSNKGDDSFIEAKMKSLVVTEVFLAPLIGVGFSTGGKVIGDGFLKPLAKFANPYDAKGTAKAFLSPDELGDLATGKFAETQKRSNSFKGKNRFELSYKFLKSQLEDLTDDVEKMLIDPAVEYIVDSSFVKKIAQEMGLTYKEIDDNTLKINNLKNNSKTPEQLKLEVQQKQIQDNNVIEGKKQEIIEETREKNRKGRQRNQAFIDNQESIKKLEQRNKELESQNERYKEELLKRNDKAAKSEKKLQEAMIVNNQVRPQENIQKFESLGISAANKPKSVMQIQKLNVEDIEVRPDIFQVKESGQFNVNGVSGSLADEKAFDGRFAGVVSVWKDVSGELGEPNKIYVIDGHNRIDLAKRSGIKEVNTQIIQAPTVDDAVIEAAMININSFNYSQKGAIAPIDVAKILKRSGAERLAKSGLNVNQRIIKEGMRLARLPQFMFDKLMGGTLSMDKGLAYGSQPVDQIIIGDVFKSLEKERPSLLTIEVTMKMANTAEVATEQGTITGLGDFMKSSNFKQLRAIRVAIEKNIKDSIKELKSISTKKAADAIETKVKGNKIKYEQNREVLEDALFMVDKFDAAASSGGRVNEIINELAAQVKGSNANKLVKDNIDRVKDAIQLDDAPLLDMDEGTRIMQQVADQQKRDIKKLENQDSSVKLTEEDAAVLKEDPEVKSALEGVDDDNQQNIFEQLQAKGKVTNNPSPIDGEALPVLITNPAARVFPDYFLESDQKLLDYAFTNPNQFTGKNKTKAYLKFSNSELTEAVSRTKRFLLTERQIKNIAAKAKKFEAEQAKLDKLEKEINDYWEAAKKNNQETVDEKFIDKKINEKLAQEEKVGKLVDMRLDQHNAHLELVAELEQRKLSPDFFNKKENKLAEKGRAAKEKEIDELKAKIGFATERGDYETPKGYSLSQPSDIDDFTFTNYGNQLGSKGLVDSKGKQYNRFYFGQPKPRFNDIVPEFENDLDAAIYIVGKQLQSFSSKQSKSHYKYIELLDDLGLSNEQILVRYREVTEQLLAGNTFIEAKPRYFSTKLVKKIADFEAGMNDINGRYDFAIEDKDIISGKADRDSSKFTKRENANYKEPQLPSIKDPLNPKKGDLSILENGGDLADDEVYFSFTDYAAKEVARLMQHVRDLFGVEMKLVSDPIKAKHNAKSAKQYGVPLGTKFQAAGFYHPNQDPLKDLVIVSMIHGQDFARFSKVMQTAFHEGFHRLYQRFYTKAEKTILKKAEKDLRNLAALVKPLSADKFLGINGAKKMGFEETVVTAASGYLRFKDLYKQNTGKWGLLFDRLGELVQRTRNFLRGRGFKSWRDIFDASYEGRIRARGMTPEGAKYQPKTEEISYEVDANELSNLFQDNLEALSDGTVSLEQMMSNVRRPLVNRKFRTKGSRYFINTDKTAFINMNKTLNQELDRIFTEITEDKSNQKKYAQEIQGFVDIPSVRRQEIARLAMMTIEDVDGDIDAVLKLHQEAVAGNFYAQKDLVSITAVKMMLDGATEVLSIAANNFKMDNSPQNGQILLAAFQDSARLNNAYASWGRITGQRLSMMGGEVEVKGVNDLQRTVELLSRDRKVQLRGDTKSLQDAIDNGVKPMDQGLGNGAYFVSDSTPRGQIEGEEIQGSLKEQNIMDLDEANIALAEILTSMGVKFNKAWDGSKKLNDVQKQAIADFVQLNNVDGIRIKGVDIGLEGDVIFVPDVNKANTMIGSKASIVPEAEREIQFNAQSFQAALSEGEDVLKRVMKPEDFKSIVDGKPTTEALEMLRIMSDMNTFLSEPRMGAKITRHLNQSLNELEGGSLVAQSLGDIFRSAIFGGMMTFYKVAFGSGQRAVMLPYHRFAGGVTDRLLRKRGKMTDNQKKLQAWRMGQQFLNAHVMNLARIHHSMYLSAMAFIEDTSFSNIGEKSLMGDTRAAKSARRFKKFEPVFGSSEGKQLGYGDYRIKESPTGKEWYLDPANASIERVFLHRVKSIHTIPSRAMSAIDTFMATSTMMTQETIRHANNLFEELLAKGVDIDTKAVRNKVWEQARELTDRSRKDIEFASGRVVKGGYFDSEYARNIADYINFTDDIRVKGNNRTLEYARQRAIGQGITDPVEMHEFVRKYMALDETNISKEGTGRANELLDNYMKEKSNKERIAGIPLTGFARPIGQAAMNIIPHTVDQVTKDFPATQVIFPVNKTPLNIFKSVARGMPVMNEFVDSFYRDINSEDILFREQAIGDVSMGSMMIGFGVGLIASGQVEISTPIDLGGQVGRESYFKNDRKRPPFSFRIKMFDGNYSPWLSLEPLEVNGQLLSLAAAYVEILNRMPIEKFTTIRYPAGKPKGVDDDMDEIAELKSVQDSFNIAGYQVIKHFRALTGAPTQNLQGQFARGYFRNIQSIIRLIGDLGIGDGSMKNYARGNRNPASEILRRYAKSFVSPQFIGDIREGIDNRKTFYKDADTGFGAADFAINTWNSIWKDMPFTSKLYEGEVDEIFGDVKTYDTPYTWDQIENPSIRIMQSLLNPMGIFRPTQERDFGIYKTIYTELNRLAGKGQYPRFINRSVMSENGVRLDDQEFNNFKVLFTGKENAMDFHQIGVKMTFSEALYYLITESPKYKQLRDFQPSKNTSGKKIEQISNITELEKLTEIKELAAAYIKQAKQLYKLKVYNPKQLSNAGKIMEGEKRAQINKDSMPVYGAGVNLNEWREIINS